MINQFNIHQLIHRLIIELGEDPGREGLVGTPARVARFWSEFIDYEPGKCDVTFEAITSDQMVVVTGIRVWSLCEHHLLPFWCNLSIGYIAQERVLGLSKFARIAHKYAHRLQLQERLVSQIAGEVEELTASANVAVVGTGQHLCMVMRGIKTPGLMTTSVMQGLFRSKPEVRQEFLALVAQAK